MIDSLLSSRRCSRRAWLQHHRPSLERDTGVGPPQWNLEPVRRTYWPQAQVIDAEAADACAATRRALAEPDAVVANAVFEHEGVRVRIDVAEPGRLVELSSAIRLPRRLRELAVKLWAADACGWRPRNVVVTTIDPDFVYCGDYRGILVEQDVSAQVRRLAQEVPGWLRELKTMLAADEPVVEPGRQCLAPTLCGFAEHCARPVPDYPISDLRSAPALVRALLEAGFDDLREVPARRLQKPLHQRIHRAAVTGEPQIDHQLITFARELAYPRAYLDFEAVQFAIPRWRGTKPYQALPFQWACLLESGPGISEQHEFLDLSGEPPMRACAERLLETLPAGGPILVYGDFERRTISLLGTFCPDLADRLRAVQQRMVDLLPWVQRHYYHRDMHGSWSLKAVLEALEVSFAEGPVQDGLAAQRAYLEAVDPATSPPRRALLEQALLAYCRQDSSGLMRLVHEFARSAV